MAVQEKTKETTIIYNVHTSTDEEGKAVYSARTISNVNPAISLDSLHSITKAVASLQKYELGEIQRKDITVVEEQTVKEQTA